LWAWTTKLNMMKHNGNNQFGWSKCAISSMWTIWITLFQCVMPMVTENLDIVRHQDMLCYTIIHKKKSCPLSPPHILTIVWFDYISITFSLLKFAGDLLH
jgi:hypothetical protein